MTDTMMINRKANLMHRTLALLLALLLTLSFCCGCGDDENVIKGAGHSFSYTLVGNPDTLDPQLAENDSVHDKMSKSENPYGDGHACEYIADAIAGYFNSKE